MEMGIFIITERSKSKELQRHGNGRIHRQNVRQRNHSATEMDTVIVIECSSQGKHRAMETDTVIVIECSLKEPQRYRNGHGHRH